MGPARRSQTSRARYAHRASQARQNHGSAHPCLSASHPFHVSQLSPCSEIVSRFAKVLPPGGGREGGSISRAGAVWLGLESNGGADASASGVDDRSTPVGPVGKAGNFRALNLLRIGRAEDSKSPREREKAQHPRNRSSSRPLAVVHPLYVKTRAVAYQARKDCATSLPQTAALACGLCGSARLPFGLSPVWKPARTPIGGSLAPKRLCAARTPQGFEKLLSTAVQPLSVDDRSALLPRLYASLVRCPS